MTQSASDTSQGNIMSKLGDRFPSASRLSVPEALKDDSGELLKLLEPYLDWELIEIDTASTDILICEPGKTGDLTHPRQFMILSTPMVNLWLRHQRSIRR